MTLYQEDFCKWVNTQAGFLQAGNFSSLDVCYLVEELNDLGGSIKRALESHYRVLFCHILKKTYQPEKATRSWELSIRNSKLEIEKILKKNPSLKASLDEIIKDAYESAKLWASAETSIDEKLFPSSLDPSSYS